MTKIRHHHLSADSQLAIGCALDALNAIKEAEGLDGVSAPSELGQAASGRRICGALHAARGGRDCLKEAYVGIKESATA
ncbi:MAG: hypothetical protein OXU68_04060 [Bacteroidota bacterium]|nr:hypothetical protein [Bacteroidota bacterium]